MNLMGMTGFWSGRGQLVALNQRHDVVLLQGAEPEQQSGLTQINLWHWLSTGP